MSPPVWQAKHFQRWPLMENAGVRFAPFPLEQHGHTKPPGTCSSFWLAYSVRSASPFILLYSSVIFRSFARMILLVFALFFILGPLGLKPYVSTFGYLQRHTDFFAVGVFRCRRLFFRSFSIAVYSFWIAGCFRCFTACYRYVAFYFPKIFVESPRLKIMPSTRCFSF